MLRKAWLLPALLAVAGFGSIALALMAQYWGGLQPCVLCIYQRYAHGAAGYAAVAKSGVPIFLDLKLHDIPNTVAAGLTSLMRLDPAPAIINVHATGGPAMLKAAAAAVGGDTRLIAVTIMTSLSDDDLAAAGFDDKRKTVQHAVNLARLSKDCGAQGVHSAVSASGRRFISAWLS